MAMVIKWHFEKKSRRRCMWQRMFKNRQKKRNKDVDASLLAINIPNCCELCLLFGNLLHYMLRSLHCIFALSFSCIHSQCISFFLKVLLLFLCFFNCSCIGCIQSVCLLQAKQKEFKLASHVLTEVQWNCSQRMSWIFAELTYVLRCWRDTSPVLSDCVGFPFNELN